MVFILKNGCNLVHIRSLKVGIHYRIWIFWWIKKTQI